MYGLDTRRVEEIQYEASRHNIQLIHCPVRHLGTELAYDVLKGMYEHLMNKTNTTFWELAEVKDILAGPEGVIGATIQRRDEQELDEVSLVLWLQPRSWGGKLACGADHSFRCGNRK